ncbi:MAG: hypothetical protein HWE13_12005 [Gammaproteobacteria bacterium]|nr:hypothetical protein [Gammaproteobacteria bacterium]
MINVSEFIKSYNAEQKVHIVVHSNNSDAEHWRDQNEAFRNQVIAAIMELEGAVKPELLRDIFRAEADFCGKIWGATESIGPLGKMLLMQTGADYIEDYFLGKEVSFDTQCAVSLGDVGRERLTTIVAELKASGAKCKQGEFTMDEVIEYIEGFLKEHYG